MLVQVSPCLTLRFSQGGGMHTWECWWRRVLHVAYVESLLTLRKLMFMKSKVDTPHPVTIDWQVSVLFTFWLFGRPFAPLGQPLESCQLEIRPKDW